MFSARLATTSPISSSVTPASRAALMSTSSDVTGVFGDAVRQFQQRGHVCIVGLSPPRLFQLIGVHLGDVCADVSVRRQAVLAAIELSGGDRQPLPHRCGQYASSNCARQCQIALEQGRAVGHHLGHGRGQPERFLDLGQSSAALPVAVSGSMGAKFVIGRSFLDRSCSNGCSGSLPLGVRPRHLTDATASIRDNISG